MPCFASTKSLKYSVVRLFHVRQTNWVYLKIFAKFTHFGIFTVEASFRINLRVNYSLKKYAWRTHFFLQLFNDTLLQVPEKSLTKLIEIKGGRAVHTRNSSTALVLFPHIWNFAWHILSSPTGTVDTVEGYPAMASHPIQGVWQYSWAFYLKEFGFSSVDCTFLPKCALTFTNIEIAPNWLRLRMCYNFQLLYS